MVDYAVFLYDGYAGGKTMAIGEIIKETLKKQGMTQKELAEKLYVKPQAVSKWINNESEPSKDNIRNIFEILGINLMQEFVKGKRANVDSTNFDFNEIKYLDTIDKARKESKRILDAALIKQNYSHPVYTLMDWLVTSTIGLAFHNFVKNKSECEEFEKGIVISYLNDFFAECTRYSNQYPNELAYQFYIMGMDLFESFGEYKLPNHDYCMDAIELWNNFEKSFDFSYHTSISIEFKTALSELLGIWGY